MVSTTAKTCPKCGAPTPAIDAASEPTAIGGPAPIAPQTAKAPKKGMNKGCLAALGCSACLLMGGGVLGIGGAAYLVRGNAHHSNTDWTEYKPLDSRSSSTASRKYDSYEPKVRSAADLASEKAAREAEDAREEEAARRLAALLAATPEPTATAIVIATPAPTPMMIRATPTPATALRSAARATSTPVRIAVATPTPHIVAIATPRATPFVKEAMRAVAAATPVAINVSTPATRATATPTMVASAVRGAAAVESPTPLPWEDPNEGAIFDRKPAAATATPAVAPATPRMAIATPTPAPAVAVAPADPNARMLHTRNGDKEVSVNHNLAITGSDGRTVVGILVAVKDGFVDVRVNGQLLRISEKDVVDAASY